MKMSQCYIYKLVFFLEHSFHSYCERSTLFQKKYSIRSIPKALFGPRQISTIVKFKTSTKSLSRGNNLTSVLNILSFLKNYLVFIKYCLKYMQTFYWHFIIFCLLMQRGIKFTLNVYDGAFLWKKSFNR